MKFFERLKPAAAFILTSLLVVAPQAWAAENILYESPGCGCCGTYAQYLVENGLDVATKETASYQQLTTLARQAGVPDKWANQPMGMNTGICHFSVIGGYTVVGHVPVEVIRRLLQEKPRNIVGIALPGMPMGSPGMAGTRKQPLVVHAFDSKGHAWVYATVSSSKAS